MLWYNFYKETEHEVPEAIREEKIRQVLAMDYVAIGQQMLEHFIAFIEETNEQAFEELLRRK